LRRGGRGELAERQEKSSASKSEEGLTVSPSQSRAQKLVTMTVEEKGEEGDEKKRRTGPWETSVGNEVA